MAKIYAYDGGVVNVDCSTTGEKTLAAITTDLPAGVNNIIVMVQIGYGAVSGGYFVLQIKKGTSVLSQDEVGIRVPSSTDRHRNSCRFLLARDANASANQSYTIVMNVSTSVSATLPVEVKALIINESDSAFVDGSQVGVPAGSTYTIASLSTSLPAGNYVIIASVHEYPTGTADYLLSSRNVKLKKGATVAASNQFRWGDHTWDKSVYAFLVYYDSDSGANPSYSVEITNDAPGYIYVEAKILVFKVGKGWFLDTASVSLSTSETTIANLTTTLNSGAEVGVIASVQFENTTASSTVIVNAGYLKLQKDNSAADQQVNDIDIYANSSSLSNRSPFAGLVKKWTASGNDSFQVKAASTQPSGINGEVKIVVFVSAVGVVHEVAVAEKLGLVDGVARRVDFGTLVSGAEKLGLIDSITPKWSAHVTVTEKLGFIDAVAKVKPAHVAVAEKLGMIDGVLKEAAYRVAAVEKLGLLDAVKKVRGACVAVAEKLGFIDREKERKIRIGDLPDHTRKGGAQTP